MVRVRVEQVADFGALVDAVPGETRGVVVRAHRVQRGFEPAETRSVRSITQLDTSFIHAVAFAAHAFTSGAVPRSRAAIGGERAGHRLQKPRRPRRVSRGVARVRRGGRHHGLRRKRVVISGGKPSVCLSVVMHREITAHFLRLRLAKEAAVRKLVVVSRRRPLARVAGLPSPRVNRAGVVVPERRRVRRIESRIRIARRRRRRKRLRRSRGDREVHALLRPAQ